MKTKLILIFLFIIINSIIFIFTEANKTKKIDIALKTHSKHVETAYKSIKYYQKIVVNNTLEFIKYTSLDTLNKIANSNEEEKKVLRKELYNNLNNKYNEIKEKGVFDLQITLPNKKSFLSLQNPTRYNDDFSNRYSIEYVNRTKKQISGFENYTTTHAYRYVTPLFNELNQFIAIVEISFSIDYIQEYFALVDEIDTHVLINKNLFSKKELNNLAEEYKEASENDDYLSIHSSFHKEDVDVEEDRRNLKEFLETVKNNMQKEKIFNIYKEHHDEEHHEHSFYSEHIDVITFYPIKNTDNKNFTWIVFYNLDNFISETLIHVKIFRVASFFILFVLLILLYIILNQRNSLAKEVEEKVDEIDKYFNMIQDGIAIADVETKKFVDCNTSFEKMTGYSKEELKLLTIDKIHPKESLEYVFKVFEEQSKTKRTVALNIPILSKDGKTVMTDVSTGAFNRDNQLFNIGIFRNIDERLDLEKKLKKFNKKLEEKVETQVQELREKDTILFQQNKMAALGEMIGNIAHQWRQPLSAISSASSGIKLQKEIDALSDEDLFNICDRISNHAQYLSNTIDDFRSFISDDKVKIKFNVLDSFNTFFKLVKGTIESNEIKVIKNIDENIEVEGYPNELLQCYINILNNAKDAFPEENADEKLIFIDVYIEDEKLNIVFKDNAGGIEEDVLSHIFEPYYTTKHKSQGTGLGLSMTHSLIVEGMKGTISANNSKYIYNEKEYLGATFTITIPIN